VFEVGGVTVAVIGAVPNNLYATTTGSGLQGNEVPYHVDAVNEVAQMLSDGVEDEDNDEADIIVASYHDGADGNGSLEEETARSEVFERIVNDTDPAVDVIFNGHSHQAYNYGTTVSTEDGTKERPVVQAGQSGNLLAAVELEIDAETSEVLGYESSLIEQSEQDAAGAAAESEVTAAVYALEQTAVTEFEELQKTQIGQIDASITTDYQLRIEESGSWRAGGTRRQETTLGNWAANALKDRVSLSNPAVDLGVTNSGGLRAELLYDKFTAGGEFTAKPAAAHGKVTLGEVLDFAPFGNTLVYFDLPGSSIKQVLEENWQNGQKTNHLGWSEELTYTYDESRAQDDKVTGIWIGGEPVDMDQMYTIATLSFLGDTSWVGTANPAPDGYEGFATGQQGYVDLGIMDNQAYQEYIEAETAANGDIRPDFSKNSVEVSGTPETVSPGEEIVLTLDDLELDSDGAGEATSVAVALETADGTVTELGSQAIPAAGETVTLSGISAPATAVEGTLVLTVSYGDRYQSTSEVRVPLSVTGAGQLGSGKDNPNKGPGNNSGKDNPNKGPGNNSARGKGPVRH
jgi:5'-nucleotidase